jgi:hypothetical protein
LLGLPPVGPAIPVTATPTPDDELSITPIDISDAVCSLTAPNSFIVD